MADMQEGEHGQRARHLVIDASACRGDLMILGAILGTIVALCLVLLIAWAAVRLFGDY